MPGIGEHEDDKHDADCTKRAAEHSGPWTGIKRCRPDGTEKAERRDCCHGHIVEVPEKGDEMAVLDRIAVLDEHIEHPEAHKSCYGLEMMADLRIGAADMHRKAPCGSRRGAKDHEPRGGRRHHGIGARRRKGKHRQHKRRPSFRRGGAAECLEGKQGKAEHSAAGTA
jgi:hypothetical protein